MQAPIRQVQGEVELLHGLLLQIQDPALPTDILRHVIHTSTACIHNALVTRYNNVLQTVKEEDTDYKEVHPATGLNRYQRSCLEPTPYPNSNLASFDSEKQRHTDHSCDAQPLIDQPLLRSLTSPLIKFDSTMTTVASVPGTPPELTESQSSKTSSYASDLSPTDDLVGGNMNFEEINLDDENHKTARNSSEKEEHQGNQSSPRKYTSKRPALATLQTQQHSNSRSTETVIRSAATPYTKRNFTSPVLPQGSPLTGQRSHSQSPILHKSTSTSRLGQFSQSATSLSTVAGRRGSWQPTRKTIYEIEAEYHESDDELPDDASLFNVPVSPLPGYPRRGTSSVGSSARGSPEREQRVLSPVPIPLGHVRTTPDTPPKSRKASKHSQRQRLTPRSSSLQLLQQSKSASTSPRNDMRYGRTRSWNLVMADLDYEARIIAQKLDFHCEIQSKSELATSNPQRSSAPGAIPLPPIQRGTLDFMPTSKEKEAVLSRTRPSWLPPKDPREERRHLEEYKKMMKASMEADKRRETRVKEQSCTTDATRDSLHRIWTYYVDPTTDLATIDSRVNDLCWRGIPPGVRGAVWQRRIGNSLGLTKETYATALERARDIKSRPNEQLNDRERVMQEWFADIERDAETAFPEVNVFKRASPLWQDLIHVCEAYASHQSDVGYTYGAQLVAALVLLQVPDPAQAFIFMANCFSQSIPRDFQTRNTAATSRTYARVTSTLATKFSSLHDYLFRDQESGGLGFNNAELFEHMFQTVFANGLDLDRLCRVWDIWIFESDDYLAYAAAALLGGLQDQIFAVQGDVDLRRRNIQELLGWGPCGRNDSGYWKFETSGEKGGDEFVESLRAAAFFSEGANR